MPNITIQNLIDILRRRIPWTVMKHLLHYHEIKKGRGWEDTVIKLEEFSLIDQNNYKKLFEVLSKIYLDHLIAGEKSTRFHSDTKDNIEKITKAFDLLDIPASGFRASYPYPLEDTEFSKVNSDLFLVEKYKQSEKLILVFCSKRHIKERVEISPKNEGSEVEKALAEYSEVIGIKQYDKQFFDIVVLDPQTNRIEIRLDISKNISADDRVIYFKQIARKFETLVSQQIKTEYKLEKSLNLFPIIDKLYRSNEGRICELAFTTEGSSIKSEKMRRRNECLRTEAYHIGGSKAVDGQISAYKIAATWECQTNGALKTQPELLLPGQASMLQSSVPLNEVIITNCAGVTDYDFVIGKLNCFLEQNESTT